EYGCSRGFATSIKQGCEESPRWLPVALIEYEVRVGSYIRGKQ
ncbi:MAG: hypothetical protein FD188_3459, partial [Ignavibacteria bacterium]